MAVTIRSFFLALIIAVASPVCSKRLLKAKILAKGRANKTSRIVHTSTIHGSPAFSRAINKSSDLSPASRSNNTPRSLAPSDASRRAMSPGSPHGKPRITAVIDNAMRTQKIQHRAQGWASKAKQRVFESAVVHNTVPSISDASIAEAITNELIVKIHQAYDPELTRQMQLAAAARAQMFNGTRRFLTLTDYKGGVTVRRSDLPPFPVVDAHFHAYPGEGLSWPHAVYCEEMKANGLLFVVFMGIGQRFASQEEAVGKVFFSQGKGMYVHPSIANDIRNAADIRSNPVNDLKRVLSFTGGDFADPRDLANRFFEANSDVVPVQWAGEMNMIKRMLDGNKVPHATIDTIVDPNVVTFMGKLAERGIPFTVHTDYGSEDDEIEHRSLLNRLLVKFPNNKIIWAHLGMSRELFANTNIKNWAQFRRDHTTYMRKILRLFPNAYMDLSWGVVHDLLFHVTPADDKALLEYPHREYIDLINEFPTRFLPGSDYINTKKEGFIKYVETLGKTSKVLAAVNNAAFRGIALGQNFLDLMSHDSEFAAMSAPNIV